MDRQARRNGKWRSSDVQPRGMVNRWRLVEMQQRSDDRRWKVLEVMEMFKASGQMFAGLKSEGCQLRR